MLYLDDSIFIRFQVSLIPQIYFKRHQFIFLFYNDVFVLNFLPGFITQQTEVIKITLEITLMTTHTEFWKYGLNIKKNSLFFFK